MKLNLKLNNTFNKATQKRNPFGIKYINKSAFAKLLFNFKL